MFETDTTEKDHSLHLKNRPLEKVDSYWKPSFLGSRLVLGDVKSAETASFIQTSNRLWKLEENSDPLLLEVLFRCKTCPIPSVLMASVEVTKNPTNSGKKPQSEDISQSIQGMATKLYIAN